MELTRGQLTWVARQARENRYLINHPDQFKIAKVSKDTAKKMKSSGFQVTKNRTAIVPLKGNDKATISRGKIIYEGKTKNGTVIRETVHLQTSETFHQNLRRIMEAGELPKNKMITAKIGESAAFNARFSSYSELMYYLQHQFTPKDKGETKERLNKYFSLVELETAKGTSYAKAVAQQSKDERAEKAARKKERKAKFNRRA